MLWMIEKDLLNLLVQYIIQLIALCIVDTLDYLPKTSIYIESKRLAINIINEYYNVASAVMDKKLVLDFQETKEAYLQSENVDILMVELVEKLE